MSSLFDQPIFRSSLNTAQLRRNSEHGRYIGLAEIARSTSVLYDTVSAANRTGKEALKHLLTEFPN